MVIEERETERENWGFLVIRGQIGERESRVLGKWSQGGVGEGG